MFYQDIIYGGVTAAGFSTGQGSGSGSFDIHIEPNSTIKKAYIFSYSQRFPPSPNFTLNGQSYIFDTINKIMDVNYGNPPWFGATPTRLYYKDITNEIDSSITSYNVTIPNQPNLQVNEGFWTLFLVVIYENPNLQSTAVNILINDKNLIGNEFYFVNYLNPINTSFPTGFSLFTDRTGGNFSLLQPDVNTYFNTNYIGKIGGSDNVNSLWGFAGVKGHFYYQNNQLFGLDDDLPNTIMDSTDGLADVSSYIPNNATSCNFQLTHHLFPNQAINHNNVKLAYFLTYTTPCDTFSTTLTDNVSICKGDTAFLLATGGAAVPLSHPAYEWLPQVGLNCYDCPNPYFTDTVSKVYTCRIWNSDSCSKVLPVRVEVVPKPLNPIIQTSPTKCSDSSGVATVQLIASSYLYALDNGAFQSNAVFSQLSAGNHSISVVDTNGCVAETNFSISETFPTANFTASPLEGEVPLDVNFTNQSTGATDFIWYIANDTLYSVNPNYTFEEEGNFNVTLVAYDTYLHCSDTASVQIFATFPFTVIAPSLFVKQDAPYQIFASNVATLQYELYNSIGQQLYHHTLHPTQGLNDVWYPYHISRGIYLYRITAKDDEGNEKVFSGKVVVI